MDLSSHGVTDEMQLGCLSDNLGEFFNAKLVRPLSKNLVLSILSKLDSGDRQRIGAELEKHSHPLAVNSDVLFNIVNGQVAPNEVNVSDAVLIGEKTARCTFTLQLHSIWISCQDFQSREDNVAA